MWLCWAYWNLHYGVYGKIRYDGGANFSDVYVCFLIIQSRSLLSSQLFVHVVATPLLVRILITTTPINICG